MAEPNEPRKSQRRSPRQARSKETVNVILEGAAQVLKSDGYHAMSTRSVAKRAGVSVGSVYQYFGSKDAVVRALNTRMRDRVMERLQEVMRRSEGEPVPTRVRTMLAALLQAKTVDPELNNRLNLAMLEIEGPCYLSKDTEPFRHLVRAILEAHRDTLASGELDLDLAAFVIVRSLEGVLAAAGSGDSYCEDPRLVDVLADLLLGMLRPSALT